MSSREKEICEKVIALVSEGETEEAISYLERKLKTIPNHDPKLFHDVILLSNMYSNYERQKLRGTLDDAKGMNRITSEVLELTERIQKHGITAPATNFTPPPPGFNTSPDPLQPAYQQPVVQRAPVNDKKGLKSRVTSVMAVIGAIFVVIVIISMFVEDDPIITDYGQEPYANEVVQPAVGQSNVVQTSDRSASEIRNKMQQLFNSGEELDEDDLLLVNASFLQRQLANTSWFVQNMNYLSFDATGTSGTYLNGNGLIEITFGTKYGFWIGTYAELTTGDMGFAGIIPPGKDQRLTIYIESQMNPGMSGFVELQRQ